MKVIYFLMKITEHNNFLSSVWTMLYSPHWLLLLPPLGISDPSKGIYACGAHSDFGMLTLLATDAVTGLQVLSRTVFAIHITFRTTGLVMGNC